MLAVLLFVFRVLILILKACGGRLAGLSSVEARLLTVEQEGRTEVPGDPGLRHVRIQRHVRKNARGRQCRLLQEVPLWQEGVDQSELLHGEDLDVSRRRLLQLQRQPLVAPGLGSDQQLRVLEGSAVETSILNRSYLKVQASSTLQVWGQGRSRVLARRHFHQAGHRRSRRILPHTPSNHHQSS